MRARKLLAPLLVVAGCAAQDGGEAPPSPPRALDAPAPLPVEQLAGERAEVDPADDELGLAEYERLLAEKEERLRAVGVLVAAREQQRVDSRYAPPPPVGGVPGDEDAARVSKAKRAASGAGASGGGRGTPPSSAPPAPRPSAKTSHSETRPAPERRPAPAVDAVAAEEEATGGRCQTICDLSAATCDLEGKICDLAQRHPGDARYADLCRRADEDCRVAAEACQRCSP